VISTFSPTAVVSVARFSDFDLRRPKRKSVRKTSEAAAESPTPTPIPAFAPTVRPPGVVPLLEAVGDAVTVDTGLAGTEMDCTPPLPPLLLDVVGDLELPVVTPVVKVSVAVVLPTTGVFNDAFAVVIKVRVAVVLSIGVIFEDDSAIVAVTTTVVVTDTRLTTILVNVWVCTVA
jgi:hypothetical protein